MIAIDLAISECPQFSKSDRRFKSYDYKREGGYVGRHAFCLCYIIKMGKKRANNGHFRPKNASIDLKIGHILYLCGFYEFCNFQRNRKKIGAKSEQNLSKIGVNSEQNK